MYICIRNICMVVMILITFESAFFMFLWCYKYDKHVFFNVITSFDYRFHQVIVENEFGMFFQQLIAEHYLDISNPTCHFPN